MVLTFCRQGKKLRAETVAATKAHHVELEGQKTLSHGVLQDAERYLDSKIQILTERGGRWHSEFKAKAEELQKMERVADKCLDPE